MRGTTAAAMHQEPTDRGSLLRYRKREISAADIDFPRETIAGCAIRKEGYLKVCVAWGWRQPNGKPSVVACQDLLLRLEERGHLQLPASRKSAEVGQRKHRLPVLPAELRALPWIPVDGLPATLGPLVVRPIEPEERAGWRLFMGRYHYLGDRPIVGEHVLYAALLGDELVALLGWASAALHVPAREKYIGWDDQAKRSGLHLVVNNVRFLVPPWVRAGNLASRVLASCVRRLSGDWQVLVAWGHPVYLAETFVDARFAGTCYRAANWIYLGRTAGLSRRGNAYPHNNAPKAVFVYPLRRKACELLRGAHR